MIHSKNSCHRIILGYEELMWIDDYEGGGNLLKQFTINAGANGATLYTSDDGLFHSLIDMYYKAAPHDNDE